MRPNSPDLKAYLHRTPIDMRAGRNRLAKLLTWDINGYGLYHKVIESRQKFHWPRLFQEEVIEMTSEQLCWLMDGYDVWSRPHKAVTFTHVS